MSCYFRHMKEVFEEAGVEITKENKKEIDRLLHGLMDVEYKACPATWKAIKDQIKGDDKAKKRFVEKLKKKFKP